MLLVVFNANESLAKNCRKIILAISLNTLYNIKVALREAMLDDRTAAR
jgi:hypothetical protein